MQSGRPPCDADVAAAAGAAAAGRQFAGLEQSRLVAGHLVAERVSVSTGSGHHIESNTGELYINTHTHAQLRLPKPPPAMKHPPPSIAASAFRADREFVQSIWMARPPPEKETKTQQQPVLANVSY